MISELLKTATAKEHSALEALLYIDEIKQGSLTADMYSVILSTNFCAYQLETKIAEQLKAATSLNLQERQKRILILEEAKTLNIALEKNIENIPQPQITSAAEALGAMYVLEGATLGGQIIKRNLERLPQFKQHQFLFYNAYGAEVGKYWKAFISYLNENVEAQETQSCIDAARKTFEYIIALAKHFRQ